MSGFTGTNTPGGNVLKTGALASSSVTANQTVLTYTVTAGKTLFLQYLEVNAMLTTFAGTATWFGSISILFNGVVQNTYQLAGPGAAQTPVYLELPEPLPIAGGTVITVVCTPSAVTPFTWEANFGGFEK